MSSYKRIQYGTKEASKLNLTQCLAIQNSNYTSKDGTIDYDQSSVDFRIYELQNSLSAKIHAAELKQFEKAEVDYQKHLDDSGVPPFPYTWDQDNQEYIMF